MRLLDLFCGRWGWSKAFAARGWECVGIDLTEPPTTPNICCFLQWDVLDVTAEWIRTRGFDFIVLRIELAALAVPATQDATKREYYHEAIEKVLEMRKRDLERAKEQPKESEYYLGRAHRCDDILFWLGHVEANIPAGAPQPASVTGKPSEAGQVKLTSSELEEIFRYRPLEQHKELLIQAVERIKAAATSSLSARERKEAFHEGCKAHHKAVLYHLDKWPDYNDCEWNCTDMEGLREFVERVQKESLAALVARVEQLIKELDNSSGISDTTGNWYGYEYREMANKLRKLLLEFASSTKEEK